MLTLGVETSCDETSVSVTDGRRVLANVVTSSIRLHKRYGGVVPEIASRFHVEYIIEVLEAALERSGKKLGDMKLIAVTNGPGLVGSLLTGITLAKALSFRLEIPLIGVNHVLAHLYSAFVGEAVPPRFPFVGLVVSGGHTALYSCRAIGVERLLGQTQDDAVGEAYDKVAKILGLGYPGGPAIEKAARASTGGGVTFPRSYLEKGSLDFSFSGVKTAVLYRVKGHDGKLDPRRLSAEAVSDICYAFQEAVLDVLVRKAHDAARAEGTEQVVVGGGVAINRRLREKFADAARIPGVTVAFPEPRYCTDNAAMIGFLGEVLYHKGRRSDLYLSAEPNLAAAGR